MRLVALSLAVAFAATGMADRLITIPTAMKLPDWTWRSEGFYNGSLQTWQIGYSGLTMPNGLEVEFRNERFTPGKVADTFDLTYNLLAPITDIAPGFAFGVQDAANSTLDGRRYFFVITAKTAEDIDISHHLYIQTTLGMYAGKRTSPMLGQTIPFGTSFSLLWEHNGYRPAAGVELKILSGIAVRYMMRDYEGYLTVQYTKKL